MKLFKENKGIIISGCALVLLSVFFTSLTDYGFSYDGNISLMTGYFARMAVRLCLSISAFVLACKYGGTIMSKYGMPFILLGIAAALFSDNGYIYIFGCGIDIVSLTNILAVLGFASYFHEYARKSVLHTVLFWFLNFLFLFVAEKEYLIVVLTVMNGCMLVSSYKNKSGKETIRILSLVLYAVLLIWAVKITVTGIVELTNLFYDTGYMATVARNVLKNIKWFGSGAETNGIGGAVSDYKLLWIFGLYGLVAGTIVFAALTVFLFFACKKVICLSILTPFDCAAVSILLIRYIISMLNNFGVVLGSLCASVPILSDGTAGYIAIFILIGMMVGTEKAVV